MTNKIYILFFSIALLLSCDSSKKELEKKEDDTRNEQIAEYNDLLIKHSAKKIVKKDLDSRFTFELEEDYLNKNISCVVNIFDIKEMNDGQYILFARGKNLSLELKISKNILDRIISYRSHIANKDDNMFSWFGFSEVPIAFIIKPYAINKRYDLYKSISDFEYETIYEENDYTTVEVDVELVDYTVDLELVNGGFSIKADCIDLTFVDEIYWFLDEI